MNDCEPRILSKIFRSLFVSQIVESNRLCFKYQDSQEHALTCEVIKANLSQTQCALLNDTYYAQLFGNVEDQEKVTRIFQIILLLREKLLNQGLP